MNVPTINLVLGEESELWQGAHLPDFAALAKAIWQEEAAAWLANQAQIASPIKFKPTASPSYELSLLLTNDDAIKAINLEWRGQDKATNVLSFPALPMPMKLGANKWQCPLGDVALAYETCVREAEAKAISLHDHVAHLFIHGMLHILGYDHEDDDEADMMEEKERQYLASWGIKDPYPDAEM